MKKIRKVIAAFAAATTLTAGGATGLYLHQQDAVTEKSICLMATTPAVAGLPVIVVPGFMNDDFYMSRLRGQLQEHGYTVYGWGEGVNTGPDADHFAGLRAQLDDVYARHGEKVIVVGYSLGGVYARELARAYPDRVSRVVTLGAPFGLTDATGGVDARVADLYRIAHGRTPTIAEVTTPPPVPTLSIFSKNDRIVPWQASQNKSGSAGYHAEIEPGHIAMPFNREAGATVLAWLGADSNAPRTACGVRFQPR